MNLTQVKNEDVYYDNIAKRKIYFSTYKDGEFIDTTEVDAEISFHTFISSSEDYLSVLAQNKEDGFANLYWVSTQVIENVRPKQ
jgi:hypothetical protein